MSFHISSRRLVRSTATLTSTPSPLVAFLAPACRQRRTISLFNFGRKKKDDAPRVPMPEDKFGDDFIKKHKLPAVGSLSQSSIFQDETVAGPELTETGGGPGGQYVVRNPLVMAAATDPNPDGRRMWERRMVIKEIRTRGRLTRKQVLKRTEREILSKSRNFDTSTKKLMHLARQIAGKTVDEAIVQMRFSVKKAAKEVKYHLEHARNEAIVRRGMGLGKVHGETGPAVSIQTKDGKRLKIEDRTRLYIDQAWVGKGDYTKSAEFRARGKVNMLKHPTASISVILKEEATRIRLHEEKEEKDRNRKPWTQLPNRPITAQRQYYSW